MKRFLSFLAFSLLSLSASAQGNYGNGTYWYNIGTANKSTNAPQAVNTIVDSSSNGTLRTAAQVTGTSFTPTVTASTYAAGLEIGVPENISNFLRSGTAAAVNGAAVNLKSIVALDTSAPSNHIPIGFFMLDTGTAALTGTYSDHTAPAFSAADLTHIVHTFPLPVTAWVSPTGQAITGGTNIVADILCNSEPVIASGVTGAFTIIPVSTGTGTGFSGTSNMITFKYSGDLQ